MCKEPIGYITPQGALEVTFGELATSVDQTVCDVGLTYLLEMNFHTGGVFDWATCFDVIEENIFLSNASGST